MQFIVLYNISNDEKEQSKLKRVKNILLITALLIILTGITVISASAADNDIYASLAFKANAGDENTYVKTQIALDGERYLFLPSSANLSELTLYYDSANTGVTFGTSNGSVNVESGKAFDFKSLFTKDADEYKVNVTANGETTSFTVMKSANVRSMYLVSSDPVNQGREWVDTSKENRANGKISLLDIDGTVDYSNDLNEIKCRGNSTFDRSDKKAYQIKIGKKYDLINGKPEEANKKWILLANMFDATLIHNSITFQLAKDLNMPYTSDYEAIDLYYDGCYVGSYLLCEKTEVGSSRIDMEDLDEIIETDNKGTDCYENPNIVTKTIASNAEKTAAANSNGSYKYVEGLIEPELAEGTSHHAYLLELEFSHRYPDELTGFVTERGQRILTDNPEYLTKSTGAFISKFWQDFENAVYSSNGYNRETGKYYYDYCDLDSLVDLYLINELAKNVDGFKSSTYFYLPEDKNMMYAGPVWDFDPCYGPGGFHDGIQSTTANPENFYITNNYLIDGLIKIESFRNALKSALNKENGRFYLAVQKMIGNDGYVNVLSNQIKNSQLMNSKLWDVMNPIYVVVSKGDEVNFDNAVKFLNNFLLVRINWLSGQTAKWNGNNFTIKTDTGSRTYNSIVLFFERLTEIFNQIVRWLNNLFK